MLTLNIIFQKPDIQLFKTTINILNGQKAMLFY